MAFIHPAISKSGQALNSLIAGLSRLSSPAPQLQQQQREVPAAPEAQQLLQLASRLYTYIYTSIAGIAARSLGDGVRFSILAPVRLALVKDSRNGKLFEDPRKQERNLSEGPAAARCRGEIAFYWPAAAPDFIDPVCVCVGAVKFIQITATRLSLNLFFLLANEWLYRVVLLRRAPFLTP